MMFCVGDVVRCKIPRFYSMNDLNDKYNFRVVSVGNIIIIKQHKTGRVFEMLKSELEHVSPKKEDM